MGQSRSLSRPPRPTIYISADGDDRSLGMGDVHSIDRADRLGLDYHDEL